MPSLYAQYLEEHVGDRIIENSIGFVSYHVYEQENYVWIKDIFVVSDERRNGHARILAEMVLDEIKGLGIKEVLGTVNPSAPGADISMKALLSWDMKPSFLKDGLVVFKKEIKHE